MAIPGLDDVADLIRSRRTNLRINRDRAVDPDLIQQLCELATWAPNHKLTQPWRFAVLEGDARARVGEITAAAQAAAGETDDNRLGKTRAKYLRAPVVVAIAVSSGPEADPVRSAEDRDAVAAGVQTFLLAATAAGLAGYWGTGLVTSVDGVKELCGFGPGDVAVAFVYLGWPTGDVPVPQRAAPRINWIR